MLLLTLLGEATRDPDARHRVVSLFGDGPMGDRYRALGVPVDIFDIRDDLRRRRPDRAIRWLTRYFHEYQPEIAEGHLTYSRLIGLLAAWRAGVPIRVGFEPGDLYLSSWKFRIANFVGQFWSHRIVPCSYALADWDHRTHGFQRKRMAVIHNCVDLERFDPSRFAAADSSFDRPACETLYCAIGTLGTGVNKRVDVIIQAVAMARELGSDVGLVIVGDGPLRPALEGLTENLGMTPHVRFLGTRSDTPQILAASDVLCHAAPFEPFGIVAIEAMAMGLPVIVPDSGGIREAVEAGVSGLTYPPLDIRALAERMVRFHRDSDERERMGLAAREAAEQQFSPAKYLMCLNALFDEIREEKNR